jgi:hypothetical protein
MDTSVFVNTSVPSTKKYSSHTELFSTLPKPVDQSKTAAYNRMTTLQGIDPPYIDIAHENGVPTGVNASKL